MTRVHPLAKRALERRALQKSEELSQLLVLVEKQRPGAVVEIGTNLGGTLLCWCELAEPEAVIVSVDLGSYFEDGYPAGLTARMRRRFPKENQTLHLVEADSHQPSTLETVKSAIGDRRLDFLFIDGDHSYEGVRLDFDMYGPLVRAGGLIALHDILPHPDSDVSELWGEVKDAYQHVEFIAEPHDWGGIGVLWQT